MFYILLKSAIILEINLYSASYAFVDGFST